MTYEEYRTEVTATYARHRQELFEIATRYALANNKVNIGDIIEDHCRRIRVDKVKVSYGSNSRPNCVYEGVLLTKKNVPYKSGERGSIWQSNLKKEVAL